MAWLVIGLVVGLVVTLVSGFTAGLMSGLVIGVGGGLGGRLRITPADLTIAADPRTVLARDRGAFLSFGLASGGSFGLVVGLVVGLAVRPAVGLVVGLAVAFASALWGGLMESAWGWFAIARCCSALRGRLPWRLMAFLADAHQRGVLRQLGAVYQFRHVELQRHLATRPR
jgi:hypothetical protein